MKRTCCYMDKECTPECAAHVDVSKLFGGKELKGADMLKIPCIRLFVDLACNMPPEPFEDE